MKSYEIISGLRGQDSETLKYIYKEYFLMIVKLIQDNSGCIQDAEDVFQEGLVVIFRKIQDRDFQINYTFKTYFYTVCKNIWLVRLRNKSRELTGFDEQIELMELDQDLLQEIYKNERYHLYRKHFKDLDEPCQQLLKFHFLKRPMIEIVKRMGFSSINYARKKKFKCKEKLIKRIQSDISYQEHTFGFYPAVEKVMS